MADLPSPAGSAWAPSDVVAFKQICKAKATSSSANGWSLNLIARGAFDGVKFLKLEEELVGVPFYKQRRRVSA